VRNLEFKARLDDPKAVVARARELGADLWGDLRQTDTYFDVRRGRLKLRETAGLQSELIFYERDEAGETRPSDYSVAYFKDPAGLQDALSRALGVLRTVKKRRTLLLLDTTRIHIDNVDGLGHFLEIEVPVRDGDEEAASRRLHSLIDALGLRWRDCIRKSYADLLGEQG
jgi:predicted adenylyl cyclase CyaB